MAIRVLTPWYVGLRYATNKIITVLLLCLCLEGCPTPFEVKACDKPCLEPFKGYQYQLCEPLDYWINGIPFEVPQGFKTDLASIPRPLWSLYSPAKSEYMTASIIHDYLYTCEDGLSRADADAVFYRVLRYQGVSQYQAYKFYLGVRLFGRRHYKC